MSSFIDKFEKESNIKKKLINDCDFLDNKEIDRNAMQIIDLCRQSKSEKTKLDSFLSEYGLDNSEGVALMCLAESILRIPDKATKEEMIFEKLSLSNWYEHINKSDSLFVNASTFGLLIAGKVITPPKDWFKNPNSLFEKLVNKFGEPVVRNSVVAAMQILSKEFVVGENFSGISEEFLKNNESSFDMLGEASRTEEQSKKYYDAYKRAIEKTHDINNKYKSNNGVSIKLSALFSRYEMLQEKSVQKVLFNRIQALINLAIDKDVEITIDAEEQDRLSLSIDIIDRLFLSKRIVDSDKVGLAIQAYGKRSINVINHFENLLHKRNSIHIRLVKGAYWDYEIKNAQLNGYPEYPVFTSKYLTDLNYLSCAKKIFSIKKVFPKFATHNAHTISAIGWLGQNNNFEFQRLFGMGELLYKNSTQVLDIKNNINIYAPVGEYKDLLPYLVRRLLENGANSSFVNKLFDETINSKLLAQNPMKNIKKTNTKIKLPKNIFQERKNSAGFDLNEKENLKFIREKIDSYSDKTIKASSIYRNRDNTYVAKKDIFSKSNEKIIGSVYLDDPNIISEKIKNNIKEHFKSGDFDDLKKIFEKIANEIEKNPFQLVYYLIHEAGKTIKDSLDEIRETIDFLRYYSGDINRYIGKKRLAGSTGEENILQYSSRGTFVCISPWNFPVAILVGQISAALITKNKVILKPSEHTPILGFLICKLFYKNGIMEDDLQLVLGDGEYGDLLTRLESINGVAFTGSLITAKKIQQNLHKYNNSLIPLIAETGGINMMLVDSSALLEQVVDDIMRSSFASAGQRCSALRVLLVQKEISTDLISLIKGAMNELVVGSSEDFSVDVGPIINKGSSIKLKDYVKSMDVIFQADIKDEIKNIFPPTLLKINNLSEINEEIFGPILHVVEYDAENLNDILEQINSKKYGLTMGIHSRIQSKIEYVCDYCNIGNIYVNRDIIGAVVESQPFGGMNLSGSGSKAGGPNYLIQFLNEKVISTNTVALGGNTELLNLETD